MKIVAIRIKNLASLEGISEIDFTQEPLRSSGIFAITGPTGAGKSTVLDALCLALYAKTPRYLQAKEIGIDVQDVAGSKIGQGDIRGILRDGTAEGYAEVEFIGIDGRVYRATWSVRRARDKAEGSLQADTVQLRDAVTNIPFGGKKTETLKEIERLVGLNFDQFTRSVLLAQGDFTAFLKADKDSKSSLLEKLTGTTIYSEISRLIFEKYKLADQDVKDLQRQLEGIVVLSEEELLLLNEKKILLENEIADSEINATGIVNGINWHTTMAELKEGKALTQAEWQRARQQQLDSEERAAILYSVERVQQIKGPFDSRTAAVFQRDKKSSELGELELYIQDLKIKTALLSTKVKETEEAEIKQKQQVITSQPLIDKAKELDILLKEKKGQLDNKILETEHAKETKEQHFNAINKQETQVNELSGIVQNLQDWKIENQGREAIAINSSLITSKLTDAKKLLALQQAIAREAVAANSGLTENVRQKQTSEKEIHIRRAEFVQAQTDYQSLQTELAAIPIDDLKNNESNVIRFVQEVVSAKAHWEVLYHSQKEYEVLTESLHTNQKETAARKITTAARKILVAAAKTEKETTERLLFKAQLQTAENVETLRAVLAQDEECPVCGSTSHPFASHNPQLDLLLNTLKDENEKSNELYDSLLKEFSAEEQLIKTLEKTIVQQQQDIEARSVQLQLLTAKWKQYKIAEELPTIAASEKAGWLAAAENRLNEELSALKIHIDRHAKVKQEMESRNENISLLERALATADEFLKDTERKRLALTEELARLEIQSDQCGNDIKDITAYLSPYFSKQDWVENWQSDPVQFEQTIQQFAQLWNEKISALDNNTHKLDILKTAVQALKQQSAAILASSEEKQFQCTELQIHLVSLQQQRGQLFEGESIVTVEQRLAGNLETAVQLGKDLKVQQDELVAVHLKADTNKEQLGKDIRDVNESIVIYSRQIADWMGTYNSKSEKDIDEVILGELLVYTHEWIEAERNAVKAINDKLTAALSAYEQRVTVVAQHEQKKTMDQSLPELLDLQLLAKKEQDRIIEERNEIGFRLRQDAENKGNISSYSQEIQTKGSILENWGKLNELLGSADGKKFRQIAQEYTLDVLLGYANVHLQLLTSRYKLARIPATLGLQIFDKDMGDEVRTVFSLSGGESFLVSLALALGLASLSSNRMKVESLFIDEGFGSLDPETLSIAMDALERLHNQGRKVGVISHVQEMTERIPTQIRVSKLSNGKSKIEVTGI